MFKTKGLAIIAITLLIFQMFSATFSMGGMSVEAKRDDKNKIDIRSKEIGDEKIIWEVVINKAKEEIAEAKTSVSFGNGQQHESISRPNNATVNQSANGYVIETSAGTDAYSFEVVTKINVESKATLQLQAEMQVDDEVFHAAEEVVVENTNRAAEETSDDEIEQQHSETEVDTESGGDDSGELEDSDKNEEGHAHEAVMENEKGSEEESIDHFITPFSTTINPNALPGVMSSETWPNPGSVKVDKKASDTNHPLEWEIELNVLGKNLQTSSDVVLVLDKSGSMSGQRLTKAKAAATEFVNTLLVPGSSTRIALVDFSETATTNATFGDSTNKQQLIDQIDGISASGGTNIQAGLHQAELLLQGSTADMKTIVLLSDGAPTYSYRGTSASSYSWPSNKYNFKLNSFNYSDRRGNGSNYSLPSGILGIGNHRYTVNSYTVRTNGIPTISEARNIINRGIDIYSIGLDVGNNADATYVLQNSNNKGYFAGGSDDLSPIFNDIAAQLNFAATEAVVTDPLGDMFDLVKDGSYNGANFSVTNGTVSWDDATETFTWDIGNVDEHKTYTFKYKVTLDCEKHPQVNTLYPTNKTTTLNYKNFNGQSTSKNFNIPKVKADTSIITLLGYRVNGAGEPVDSTGNVVGSPEEAQRFFTQTMGIDEFLQDQLAYPNANTPAGYQLHEYELVETPILEVCLTVPYGFVNINELPAANVIVKHVDENGNDLIPPETLSGNIGDPYSTSVETIAGYTFKDMDPTSAPATGTFTTNEQIVIYMYEKLTGSITINKVDENNEPLGKAKFTLTGPNGYIETKESDEDNGEIIFENLEWGVYTLKEVKAPTGYRLLSKEYTFEINANNLEHFETIENSKQDWDLPETGGVGTLGFYGVGFILMAGAGWLLYRRKHV